MGGQRQSLIDVELARTEFRLDVIKLRKQLAEIGVRRSPEEAPAPTVVTTPEGTVVVPSSGAAPAPEKADGVRASTGTA